MQSFSSSDYDDIVNGWQDKLIRVKGGEQRWGLFLAEKWSTARILFIIFIHLIHCAIFNNVTAAYSQLSTYSCPNYSCLLFVQWQLQFYHQYCSIYALYLQYFIFHLTKLLQSIRRLSWKTIIFSWWKRLKMMIFYTFLFMNFGVEIWRITR